MDEEDFTLSTDDTIRRLRDQAMAPGELKWRMDLLSKLDKMASQQVLLVRGIAKWQVDFAKKYRHVDPAKLTVLIQNAIRSELNARNDKSFKAAALYILKHWVAPLALAYAGVKLGLKT